MLTEAAILEEQNARLKGKEKEEGENMIKFDDKAELDLASVFGEPEERAQSYMKDSDIDSEDEVLTAEVPTSGPLSADDTLWNEACDFFGHDPYDKDHGVQLPGLRWAARNYQMVDVYKMLQVRRTDKLSGTLNCSKPGLGKTFEVLMAAGAVALAQMSRDHFKQYESLHGPRDSGTCRLNHKFGVQCYCIKGGLSQRICGTMFRAPQLIVCPAGLVKQWVREWEKMFADIVSFPGDGDDYAPGSLLRMAWIEHRELKTASVPSMSQPRDLTKADFQATPVLKGELLSNKQMRALWKIKSSRKSEGDRVMYKSHLSQVHKFLTEPCYPKYMPDTSDGWARERLLLVCSSNVISQGSFDEFFTVLVEAKQRNQEKLRRFSVTRCFVPSALYYDEWTEGKGTATKIIAVLKDLCRSIKNPNTVRHRRPLVALLSGTPMPRGPRCLEGVLPLIMNPLRVKSLVQELWTAYQQAQYALSMERQQMASGSVDDDVKRLKEKNVRDWLEKANKRLGDCMFQRQYGMPFLGGFIPDPRPTLRRYPPIFPPLTAAQEQAMEELKSALSSKIRATFHGRACAADLEKIRMMGEFQIAHRCSVIPGIAALGPEVVSFLKRGAINELQKSLQGQIIKVACDQLLALEKIVHSRSSRGDSGLVLSLTPGVAMVAAEWLTHRLGEQVTVLEVRSTSPRPADRPRYMQQLAERTNKAPVVVVSTYQLLSTGLDGIQNFANYLVKLGEPWTTKESEQAEGRIHRQGQKKPTAVYSIHGAENSIDWELVQKNKQNLHLLGGANGSIIGALLAR